MEEEGKIVSKYKNNNVALLISTKVAQICPY